MLSDDEEGDLDDTSDRRVDASGLEIEDGERSCVPGHDLVPLSERPLCRDGMVHRPRRSPSPRIYRGDPTKRSSSTTRTSPQVFRINSKV